MKKMLSTSSYFFRAKVFAYLMALTAIVYFVVALLKRLGGC
jgi:hypothetical protein